MYSIAGALEDATEGRLGSKEAIGAVEEINADTAEGSPGRNEAIGAEREIATTAGGRLQPRAESVVGGKLQPIGAGVMSTMDDAENPGGGAMDDAAEGRANERPDAAEVESISRRGGRRRWSYVDDWNKKH
ncbi:hypothetical protein IMY05_007G0083700 [Salix suchowensis]|nr:hypothetical protein IMY05_007G0083700 [Salix suchowensis]